MSFQRRNSVTNQAAYAYPRATVGDTVFYRISRRRTRTRSTYNFAIAKERSIVPKPKWIYNSRARHWPTAGDTTVSWICKMAGNNQKWWIRKLMTMSSFHTKNRLMRYAIQDDLKRQWETATSSV